MAKKCVYTKLERDSKRAAARRHREDKASGMAGEEAEVKLVPCKRMNERRRGEGGRGGGPVRERKKVKKKKGQT